MLEVRLKSKVENAQLGSGGSGEGEFKLSAKNLACARRLTAAWVRTNPDFKDCEAIFCSDIVSDLGDRNVVEVVNYKNGKRQRKPK